MRRQDSILIFKVVIIKARRAIIKANGVDPKRREP